MTGTTVNALGTAVAALLLVVTAMGNAAPHEPCSGLAMMTRQVRWELRTNADEFYQQLRAAETKIRNGVWTNMYESAPVAPGDLVTYLSLQPGSCGHGDDLDIHPDAAAGHVLDRTLGARVADDLFETLDQATFSVTVQAFRAVAPHAAIPWRNLGAPLLAITRTDAGDVRWPGSGLLVAAEGSRPLHLWMRPISAPPAQSWTVTASITNPDTQIFHFRPDLSSPR